MAKKYMYVRIDYDSVWVNEHGAAVEMDPVAMECFVEAQLTQCHPLDEMKVSVQITNHEDSKSTVRSVDNRYDPYRGAV